VRDVTFEDTNSPLIVQKGVLADSSRREILHAMGTTMDQHFTKIKAVAGQEFADPLFHMLQPGSLHGSVRLARILKRRQDDQAMTLRSRIALIQARTSADLSELPVRQSHMSLVRGEQGNLAALEEVALTSAFGQT
jgi:hypothetical protein